MRFTCSLIVFAIAAAPCPAKAAPVRPVLRAKQVVRRTQLGLTATATDLGAKLIGEAERVGLRYKVKTYEAQVSPNLWRGSRLPEGGYADLAKRGFKSIIGLTEEKDLDAAGAKAFGLTHDFIPILDNSAPKRAQVDKFLSIVRQKENLPVYVHCEAGIGRTGEMVAVYRMAVEGWPAGKAIVEARKYGMKLRSQISFLRQFGQDLQAGLYSDEAIEARAQSPITKRSLGVTIHAAGEGVATSAYWLGKALKPVPAAVLSGLQKRLAGARGLPTLAQADLSAMAPEELAERAATLLYAAPLQRLFKGRILRETFARVLSAYDADKTNGPAKTEQLLSRMVLSEQNAAHMARRLGKDSVAQVRAKLASLRIDSSKPVDERIAELKRRVELGDGATKRGSFTFFQADTEIQDAMIEEIHKARAAAQSGKPAFYLFSTYALEDDAPGHHVGARFADELKQAADAGVQVIGLYDQFGSKHSGVENANSDRSFYKEMSAHVSPDAQQRIALVPIKPSPLISHGSHQKWSLAVASSKDGEAQLSAMVQDANIGSLYQGKGAPWQGTAARIEGPPTEDVAKMVRDRLIGNGYQPSEPLLRALASKQKPVAEDRSVEMSIMNHVAGRDLKNKRFVLNTISSLGKGDVLDWSEPYADDKDITAAILSASKDRGAEIHLVFDRNNDVKPTANAERATYHALLDAGVFVHEYGKTLPTQRSRKDEPAQVADPAGTKIFSHAKVMLVHYANGQKLLAMGSANGDNRSEGDTVAGGVLTGNDETLAVMWGGKAADVVERDFMIPQLTRWSAPITVVASEPTMRSRVDDLALRATRGLQ